ncbi:Protein of unknown function [Cotesia congregata]|uniref:Uncharacterized protein n=1 Tax=Cotesia congregata TaxID=51543 RepID=A0A8J2EM23_COTCN|nr:Protein of unknown function [Cotesia congregata]
MRRGPYQKYFDRFGKCAMPRSTFYLRKKQRSKIKEKHEMEKTLVAEMRNHNSNSPKYHLDIIHDAQQLSHEQNVEIIDINSSTDNTNGKVYGLDSNLWLRDELDEHETTRHSWFDDDYNEQLNEEEVWFEAEERLDEPFYESTSNDFHQQVF